MQYALMLVVGLFVSYLVIKTMQRIIYVQSRKAVHDELTAIIKGESDIGV